MFQKATKDDLARIFACAGKEPELNLFMIGDLEFYGMDNDFIDVWIETSKEGTLKTILLRYHRNFLLHSETNDYDRAAVLSIAQTHNGAFLNCSGDCFAYLREAIPATATIRPMTMARMNRLIEPDFVTVTARRAVPADAEAICRSIFAIAEFKSLIVETLEERIERSKEKIADGFSTHFVVEDDGAVIANANTIAISRKAAMIGGVFTLPAYRGKGMATSVVSTLCRHLLEGNIVPVLFFENPAAATIYHKLGFVDFAEWVVVRLASHDETV